MATAKVTRQSRKRKFSKSFVTKVVKGEIAGRHTDSESPLRIKSTKTGAQYFTTKKVDGKPRDFIPKSEDGSPLSDTATLWTLEEARAWAKGVVVDIARGVDPEPERKGNAGDTFQDLASQYLVTYASTHTAASTRAEGYGIKYAAEVLGALRPDEITAAEARRLQAHHADSPANSRKAWGAARRVLDVAVERGRISVNVFAALRAPKAPAAKSRYPGLSDLPLIEKACLETRGIGSEIIRFCMRLPLRPDTVASLAWSEVDLDQATLNLRPGEGRKFGAAQKLPLPGLAKELLEERLRLTSNPAPEDLVFGSDSPTNPGGKFSGWSGLYARIRKRSIGGWSAHDFRRSCVSLVAEHCPDVSEEALDRLLTHAQSSTNSGVKAVYQRAQGFASMQRAAGAWDELLRGALAENVVRLRRVG